MSQHDMIVDNNNGAGFRADMNLALQALASNSAGATEPATKYPWQFWMDTSSGILKQRNGGNTLWNNFVPPGALPITGGTLTGNLTIDQASAANASLILDKPVGSFANVFQGRVDGLTRWQMLMGNSGAESGGNAGSDWVLSRFSDAGSSIDSPITISRATGVVAFSQMPSVGGAALPTGQMVRRTYTNGTFTWNKPAGLKFLDIELWGAGGGGGGAGATGASQGSAGGGGAAGGYARRLMDQALLSAAHTVTVPAGGAGSAGANGATPGTASFGAHLTCTGGNGGNAGPATSVAGTNAQGTVGGSGANGDINARGAAGANGTAIPFALATSWSGRGGDTALGGGGRTLAGSADGENAVGFGSGGGGACNGQNQTAKSGGTGGNAFCVVTEYY